MHGLDVQARVLAPQGTRLDVELLAAHVDGHVHGGSVERSEEHARLRARAAPWLDDARPRPDVGRDGGEVGLEQRELAARQVVLRYGADLLEEPGAARIVEEPARQPFLGGAQAHEHVIVGAGVTTTPAKRLGRDHVRSFAIRAPLICQRAEGGKKFR